MKYSITHIILAATFVLSAGSHALAGPLSPPAGPITSTYKTLTEVEPRTAISATNTPGDADSLFKISQPGSYYLTGNIAGVVDKHGIEISASNVTLDLNGFELTGIVGSLSGVNISSGNTVVNGTVRNWGGVGVGNSTGESNARIDRIHARSNSGGGISVTSGCTVSGCATLSNGGIGIRTGDACKVNGCSVTTDNLNGIVVGIGSTVSLCIARSVTGSGISAGSGCTISQCSVYVCSATGITTGTGCTVVDCTAHLNERGISVANSSSVIDCVVTSSTENGISVFDQCSVEGCNASDNGQDGIRCGFRCIVRGNVCQGNGVRPLGGAGIHATGTDNRIESNACSGADRGFDIDSGFNLIVRNTSTQNTVNWDVVANNKILVLVAVSAPAILGNAGGAALGSTDPNANFSY